MAKKKLEAELVVDATKARQTVRNVAETAAGAAGGGDVAPTRDLQELGKAAKETGSRIVSSVILQNVPVIATDRDYDLQSDTSGYGTMTLSLPTKAAIMLVQARTMGQITYLLRNMRDTKTTQDRTGVTVAPGSSFGETVKAFQ
jgi:Flp pilus assembly protein CpaB